MITIPHISETTCKLYSPEYELVGEITSELQLYDVRCQIKEQQLSGYTLSWQGKDGRYIQIKINKFGQLEDWPEGFFDKVEKYLIQLIDWDQK